MRKIPSTILDTDHAPAGARFALWREAISPTHEAALPDGSDPDRFSAYARGFNLGPCLAIETLRQRAGAYPHVARGPCRSGRFLCHPAAAAGPLAR